MVHSEVSAGMVRDPLGIPKSPSFHSGLDLVAVAVAGTRANGSGGGANPPLGRENGDENGLFGSNGAGRQLPLLLGMLMSPGNIFWSQTQSCYI